MDFILIFLMDGCKNNQKEVSIRKIFFITVIFASLLFLTCGPCAAEISSQEFLSSDFAKFFQKKEYTKALSASEALLKKHPDDALILRYRGLTLEKLNRRSEAIKVYQQILSKNPNYAPAHLFLGLAYMKEKKNSQAAGELRWVVQNSPSKEYKRWASAQLNRLRLKPRTAAKPVKRKTYFLGKVGVAYDSNALLIPDDEALSLRDQKGSALYSLDVSMGYPLRLEKDFRLDALYIGSQRSHDYGARQVDFTSQGFAVDAKKRKLIGERAVLFGGRYDFRANFLRSDLFSIVNRFFVSADTSFRKKTGTHTYGRFAVLNYGPDGANPDLSSRDGVRGGLGLTQYFYTENLKTFFFIKGEGNFNQTRGDNFVRNGALARVGFHTPLKFCKKTDLDISGGYDWGTYPEFVSLSVLEPEERVDNRFDVYTGLTHHWKKDLATRVFYRFINSQNTNDFYDRTRHIAGTEMIFSF